ncbi:aldehyde reductase [Amycolatopsis dongchuanensis]|uniref:Aldehyde reductase n=1 Tax=Amycolatopsis dongchuanensis TaxID=1070866 RepID=A0ABP8VPA8_9PSEU
MAQQKEPVLVTGGSGYLGAHVVARLLRDGYAVRTTVRSPERAAEVREAVAEDGDLEFVAAELGSDEGWAEAVAGCAYVLHVASPFPAVPPERDEDVIVPARDGALRVLRAARDAGVRRVVLTSSFAAVGYGRKAGNTYDETDWTDPAADNSAYIRSKAIAERAAWDFAREGGPELTVINPTGIFGPLLVPRVSASPGHVKAMLDGDLPVAPPYWFGVVDVRDVADLHVRAMTEPAAAGERFLASGERAVSFLEIARVLARRLGERAARVPTRELTLEEVRANPALKDVELQYGRVPVISTAKARKVFGWQPRDVETTIVDTAESLARWGLLKD